MIGNKAALPNRRAALDSQQAQQDNLLCLFLYVLRRQDGLLICPSFSYFFSCLDLLP